MPRFVLSTVGISLFINQVDPELRGALNRAANVCSGLSEYLLDEALTLAAQAAETLRRNDVQKNRALSAELNGLYGLYNDQLAQGRGDMHYLITTDTVLGRLAAGVVESYLRECGLSVSTHYPPGFTSDNPKSFAQGIKQLIAWCEETLPGYQGSGYRIVFNLTGAFKSLQGYLNIVGMFYADAIIYIFEGSRELLTIPRLPIQVDIGALRDFHVPLALLAQGQLLPTTSLGNLPEGLLDVDEQGVATLSDWGLLTWNRARGELLSEELLPFPRLEYADSFRREFRDADRAQRVDLQETLAKIAMLLEEHNGDLSALKRDPGLQYDNYTGRQTSDGRPIGHFRLNQGRRVSCVAEPAGQLALRHFGAHDYVNGNP